MSHTNTPTTQGRIKRAALAASLSALLLSLAACGGGGSDSTPSTPSAPATPSTPVADQPIMDVPAPTYAAGSPELAAYNLLNDERARCGFGRLAQNTKLDYAAKMHGLYLQANQTTGHDEDPTKPAFYGATAEDRLSRANYPGRLAGETIGYGESATSGIRALLSTPYHAKIMLDTAYTSELGLAFTQWNAWYGSMVVDFGATSSRPSNLAGIRTYPCEGTIGVKAIAAEENPSPFPGQKWGQPIYVAGDDTLNITAASVTGPQGDVPLLGIMGKARLGAGFAAIVPAKLSPSTVYTVTVNGTNKGEVFSRTFRFQTGAE